MGLPDHSRQPTNIVLPRSPGSRRPRWSLAEMPGGGAGRRRRAAAAAGSLAEVPRKQPQMARPKKMVQQAQRITRPLPGEEEKIDFQTLIITLLGGPAVGTMSWWKLYKIYIFVRFKDTALMLNMENAI